MKKTKSMKSIAAAASAVIMAASMLGTTASAFSPYYTGDSFDYSMDYSYNNDSWNTYGNWSTLGTSTTSTTSYNTATSTSSSAMPQKIYMTVYTSGSTSRISRAQSVISAAEGLLANIDSASLGLQAPTFSGIQLRVGSTKYDYLIEPNAENDATVLTFNSQSNLTSGMNKIKKEEQEIIDAALAPYVTYVESLIKSGSYTKVNSEDDTTVKAAKLSNSAILTAIKSTLTYTYTDLDLFSGDVTGDSKTYQIAYLSKASVGTSSTQTVVSNDEEFTNFPRLIIDGNLTDWGSVKHLDIFNNSNNSWWYALKDGYTLNNDFYWLKGMMIPDFEDSISFDAYAGTEWKQYGSISTSSSGSTSDTSSGSNYSGTTSNAEYYYNSSYNYASDNVYAVIINNKIVYYPNIDYAKAACSAYSGAYIYNITTASYTASTPYFCFVDGKYYSSTGASSNPAYTAYMSNVSSSNSYSYDTTDPYYLYWTAKLQELKEDSTSDKNTTSSSSSSNKSDKTTTTSKKNTDVITDDNEEFAYVSAETLATLRASGDTLEVASGKSVWTIKGDDVKTAKDVNLRVTYNTKNIPDSLRKSLVSKEKASGAAQITIGENLEWGMNASVNIKFKTKFANFIAKLYRYDTKTNSLVYVNTATIGNTGRVTFNNIDHGGDYVIVLS